MRHADRTPTPDRQAARPRAINPRVGAPLPHPVLRLLASRGNRAATRMLDRAAGPVLQRQACACAGDSSDCESCAAQRPIVARRAVGEPPAVESGVPPVVGSVLRSRGEPLDPGSRAELEPRFGHDFGAVRVHTDARAAASAKAVHALAYTVGQDIVFASGQHAPRSGPGRRLLAHELAHVVQQSSVSGGIQAAPEVVGPANGVHEREADVAAAAVLAGGHPPALTPTVGAVQRRPAPYIKKILVHLAPPQNAVLEWEGSPPADAVGTDVFTVSTGKGYGDPGDPPGTCTRDCCANADTQCAPPWNKPEKVGSCCTYFGSAFWTGTPRTEHNGWQWWTPIQPFYSIRGIALHQHHEVTGQPIGHGCVRMEEGNAKRIFDFSNGRRTNVTIDGRAAPVDCQPDRRCGAAGGTDGKGARRAADDEETMTAAAPTAVPGLEGVMS